MSILWQKSILRADHHPSKTVTSSTARSAPPPANCYAALPLPMGIRTCPRSKRTSVILYSASRGSLSEPSPRRQRSFPFPKMFHSKSGPSSKSLAKQPGAWMLQLSSRVQRFLAWTSKFPLVRQQSPFSSKTPALREVRSHQWMP